MLQGSPDLLVTNSPHPDRVHNWEHRTNTPYDPLDAAAVLSHKEIQSPCCEQRMVVRMYHWVPAALRGT